MNDPTTNNLPAALLDQQVAGLFHDKEYAFVVVLTVDGYREWGLGIAVKDEPGYNPVVSTEFAWDKYDDASDFARAMNRHIGLDYMTETKLIASTMRNRGLFAVWRAATGN